jgi:hypothetical protein
VMFHNEKPTPDLLKSLASHVTKSLPKFAVPLFLRHTKAMAMTGTNKQQKHHLREEGVDVSKVKEDKLYWLKDGAYVPFEEKDWAEITGGRVRL